ncbi:hypothetical protein VTJ49DRAFT_3115 [Mycothermus thermophilus]|uniref:Uncharacterized protein n=1 Tax=Humicola insolens TaxID=85995 RepID=A0ABR3V8K6_HUMIN
MKRIVGPRPSEETTASDAALSSTSPSTSQQTSPQPVPVPSSELPSPASTSRQRQSPPPDLLNMLAPSLKVGAAAGACGAFTGAAAGIIRSAPVVLFSGIAGVQCFTLGTSYHGARQVGLNYFKQGEEPTPREKVKASTVAGGVAGTLGGMLRGPRNIIPGALVFSLLGAGGQVIVNRREARAPAPKEETGSSTSNKWWSRWSPITRLSDEDYAAILEERILQLEADIAIVDDRIKEIRKSERHAKKDAAFPETSNSNPPSSSKA